MATPLVSRVRSISLSSDSSRYRPVTAVIDIGTSTTGYAFAFKKKGKYVTMSTFLNDWQLGPAATPTNKAPTCLLLKPDKQFDSFGYTAVEKYAKLCDTYKQCDWWYFDKLKTILCQTKLSRNIPIKDAQGKSMPAMVVFTAMIAHLKECIMRDVRAQKSRIEDDDIQYVIPVPVSWSDAAKQFLREAATDPRVGINDKQLRLVLDPEAASVYCLNVLLKPEGSVDPTSFPVGQKYIVIDVGGGTVDIVTHEVIEQRKLQEIHVAREDSFGGQSFNIKFLEFLESLFGCEISKSSESRLYLQLFRMIEAVKLEITKTADDVLFKMGKSLLELLTSDTYMYMFDDLDCIVSQSDFVQYVEVVGEATLSLSNGFLRGFFRQTLNGIEENIREITNKHGDIGTIFLVGGLAKAPYIRDFIGSRFPDYRMIAPEDLDVAVLKGAILLGIEPHMIAGRIARYTYGVGVAPLFKEGFHREEYRFTREGEDRCGYVFKKLIEKGQILECGQTFETQTTIKARHPDTKMQTFETYMYKCTQVNPMYITDEGCSIIGRFEESPPEEGWRDFCRSIIQVIVGGAELHVKTFLQINEDEMDFLLQ